MFSARIESIEIGVSEECGCHEEACIIWPFDAILHLEPDGSGHMFLDDGESEYDENLPCKNIEELRQQAINFVNNLFKQKESDNAE